MRPGRPAASCPKCTRPMEMTECGGNQPRGLLPRAAAHCLDLKRNPSQLSAQVPPTEHHQLQQRKALYTVCLVLIWVVFFFFVMI